MPFKRTRIPKYLIMEDNNPPSYRRFWSWTLSIFLLAVIAAFVLI